MKLLTAEGNVMTISLQEKGSRYLVDDKEEDELPADSLSIGTSKISRKRDKRSNKRTVPGATTQQSSPNTPKTTKTPESLNKTPVGTNQRLRRSVLGSFPDSKWCPPQFICHGRTNITKTTQIGKLSFQQMQLPPPAKIFNIKLQVKSNTPLHVTTTNATTSRQQPIATPMLPKQQQQQQKERKIKRIVISFYGNENISSSRRRRNLRNDNVDNLEMVLVNLEECFSVMDFMKKQRKLSF